MILTSSTGVEDFSVTVDLGFGDDSWVLSDSVFVNVCNSDVVHGR